MASKRLTPIQSIKKYCKELCSSSDLKSWKECNFDKCFLFSYRLGKRPLKQPFEAYMSTNTTQKSSTQKQVVLPIKFTKNSITGAKNENHKPLTEA